MLFNILHISISAAGKLVKSHCEFLWLDRHQLMKQFLDLLVFTLGKEYQIRHRVLCVVGFLITLSSYHLLLSTLCQTFLTHSGLISFNDCSSF